MTGEKSMKKFLLGAVGLIVLSMAAPASAADLGARPYSKAPAPMMAAIYDWSGFYIGLNGGWGTERRCFDAVTVGGTLIATDGCQTANGAVAGGQIGYRWQTGAWVFGLEAQGDWADLRGSNPSILNPGLVNRSRLDAFGLFTGQIGYAVNNALLYVKGGGAVVSDRNDMLFNGVVFATAPGDNRWGGTAGAGVEFGFAPNWSAAVEYDHLFIGNRATTFSTPAITVFSNDRVRGDADVVTAKINYRWGGPVIAKY
jgi:outer membrane immunogenic protein